MAERKSDHAISISKLANSISKMITEKANMPEGEGMQVFNDTPNSNN